MLTLDNNGNGTATDGFGDTDTLRSIENITGTAAHDRFNLQGPSGRTIDGGGGDDTATYQQGNLVRDLNTGNVWDAGGVAKDNLSGIENLYADVRTVLPDYDVDFTLTLNAREAYDYSGAGGGISVAITEDDGYDSYGALYTNWPPRVSAERQQNVAIELSTGAVHEGVPLHIYKYKSRCGEGLQLRRMAA